MKLNSKFMAIAAMAPAGAYGLNLLTLLRDKIEAQRGTALNVDVGPKDDITRVSAIGASDLSEKTVFFTDGFNRVGCSTDVSPMNQRITFKDKACKEEGVSSCFLTSLPMEPRLCFDFCREQGPEYRFFGISGGDNCYCTIYYDKADSTGGNGQCDIPCAGDEHGNEMCGGADITSLFEMHMCANSVKEAEVALALAEKSVKALNDLVADVASPFEKNLKTMSERWVLEGACSLQGVGKPCEYKGKWLEVGNKLKTLIDTQSTRQSDEMTKVIDALKILSIKEGDSKAGENADLPAIEKSTKAVEAQTRVVNEQVELLTRFLEDAKVGLATTPQQDPIQVEAPGPEGKKEVTLFEELGDTEKNWHAVCDMEEAGYGTVVSFKETDHKLCSKTCLEDTNCMGYNVAVVDDVMSCTFLSREGLTKPAIAFAVPVFEISQTKVDALKFKQIGCFMRKTFMNDNGRGKTKTDVKKRITNV